MQLATCIHHHHMCEHFKCEHYAGDNGHTYDDDECKWQSSTHRLTINTSTIVSMADHHLLVSYDDDECHNS